MLTDAVVDAHHQLAIECAKRDELLAVERERIVVLQRMLGAASAMTATGHLHMTLVQAALNSWRRATEYAAFCSKLREESQRADTAEKGMLAETAKLVALRDMAENTSKRLVRAAEARAVEAEARLEAASATAEAEAVARQLAEERLTEMAVELAKAKELCSDALRRYSESEERCISLQEMLAGTKVAASEEISRPTAFYALQASVIEAQPAAKEDAEFENKLETSTHNYPTEEQKDGDLEAIAATRNSLLAEEAHLLRKRVSELEAAVAGELAQEERMGRQLEAVSTKIGHRARSRSMERLAIRAFGCLKSETLQKRMERIISHRLEMEVASRLSAEMGTLRAKATTEVTAAVRAEVAAESEENARLAAELEARVAELAAERRAVQRMGEELLREREVAASKEQAVLRAQQEVRGLKLNAEQRLRLMCLVPGL